MSNTLRSSETQPSTETMQALQAVVGSVVDVDRRNNVSIESPTFHGRAYLQRFREPTSGVKNLSVMEFIPGSQPSEQSRTILAAISVRRAPGTNHSADPIDEYVLSQLEDQTLTVEHFKKEGISNAVAHEIGMLASGRVRTYVAARRAASSSRRAAFEERERQRALESTKVEDTDILELIGLIASVSHKSTQQGE